MRLSEFVRAFWDSCIGGHEHVKACCGRREGCVRNEGICHSKWRYAKWLPCQPLRALDIAWGITSALENPDRAKVMGLNGRRLVVENFTWESVVNSTARLYEGLLGRRRGS